MKARLKPLLQKADSRITFIIPTYFILVVVFAVMAAVGQEWVLALWLSSFAAMILLFGFHIFQNGLTWIGKGMMLVTNALFIGFLVVHGGHGHSGYFWVFPLLVATIQVMGATLGVLFAVLLLGMVWQLDAFGWTDTALSSRFYFAALGLVLITGVHEFTLERHRKELSRQVKDKQRESCLDPLTRVGNRRLIDEELATIYTRESAGTSIGLLMVDLDNFKQINDAFGHHAGDEVLKTIASHLSESVRPSDAVARWGGDEFVVLLHPIRLDELEAVAKRIQQSIVQDERLTSFDLSVSMGGALTSSDYRALLKVADENLIEMKNHTKNDYKITRL